MRCNLKVFVLFILYCSGHIGNASAQNKRVHQFQINCQVQTTYSVTIEDNGKGFDTSDKLKFDGMGLKNIYSRIEFLKGTTDMDSAAGKGTLVAINVPVS